MSERYSFFALARHAVNGKRPWARALLRPTLKKAYDAVIVGGGGVPLNQIGTFNPVMLVHGEQAIE